MKKILLFLLNLFSLSLSYCQTIDWVNEIKGKCYEEIKCTVVSPQGDILITGYIDASYDVQFGKIYIPYTYPIIYDTYFTAKCDSMGNFKWVSVGGGGLPNRGSSVSIDGNNDFYSTGYCIGNAKFDNFIVGSYANNEKTLLIKNDANGTVK